MSFEKKKRFGAEFMEVVQPSRCLLGCGVFTDEFKVKNPTFALRVEHGAPEARSKSKTPLFAARRMGHPTERDAFMVD